MTRGEYFGAPPYLEGLVHGLTAIPVIALALAWGTIGLELSIGVLLAQPRRRWRPLALAGSVLLHAGILVIVGLWSFGFVMVGAVVAACLGCPSSLPGLTRRGPGRGARKRGDDPRDVAAAPGACPSGEASVREGQTQPVPE